MKERFLLLFFCLFTYSIITSQVAISTTGVAPDKSAMLEVISTDKGMLIPRMTSTERLGISSPATGLLVFDTTTGSFWFYGTANWTEIIAEGRMDYIQDTDADTKVSTEFLSDEDKIRFHIDGIERWQMDSSRLEPQNAGGSVFIGESAGYHDDLKDKGNVAIGRRALHNNTDKFGLVAVGDSALYFNGVGATEISQARGNTAVGSRALKMNSTGLNNTAIGFEALKANTSGRLNTAVGANAMKQNTKGERNTALGNGTLIFNQGDGNTGLGNAALYYNISGSRNTAVGNWAMLGKKSGVDNTALGHHAMYRDTSSNGNVAIGASALYSNFDRSRLVAIGDSALFHNGIGTSYSHEATENTAVGSRAMYTNTKGYRNTAVGYEAMRLNTTGSYNTAIGVAALDSNTTGTYNTSVGSYSMHSNKTGEGNNAFGYRALYANTEGKWNVAIGSSALYENQTGFANTGVGFQALTVNTDGNRNTAIGWRALYSNTTGSENTTLGMSTLYNNTTGGDNTAVGYHALLSNLTGHNNTALGKYSLNKNTSGYFNAATGKSALYNNTTGAGNTANGVYALDSNTVGSYNAALGFKALRENKTGDRNTAIGTQALFSNVSGAYNIAIGSKALYNNVDIDGLVAIGDSALYFNTGGGLSYQGTGNTAVGSRAMKSNTTGYYNTAFGDRSLYSNTGGYRNVACGMWSMYSNSSGTDNSAFGYRALYNNEIGGNNTAVGNFAGYNTKGYRNIFIGFNAGFNFDGSDVLFIENSSSSAPLIYGDFAADQLGVNINPSTDFHIRDGSDTGSEATLRLQSGTTNEDAQIEFFEHFSGAMSIHYDGGVNNLYFKDLTTSTNRITIERDGFVGIGTGTPENLLHVEGGKFQIGSAETFEDGGVYEIAVNSDIRPFNDNSVDLGTGSYRWQDIFAVNGTINTSDERDKENIRESHYGLEEVMALNPVMFNWKDHAYQGDKIGLIAQDLLHIVPEVVKTERWVKEETTGQLQKQSLERYGVYYADLIPVLIRAIQEQQQQIEDQQARIDALLKAMD